MGIIDLNNLKYKMDVDLSNLVYQFKNVNDKIGDIKIYWYFPWLSKMLLDSIKKDITDFQNEFVKFSNVNIPLIYSLNNTYPELNNYLHQIDVIDKQRIYLTNQLGDVKQEYRTNCSNILIPIIFFAISMIVSILIKLFN